MNKYVIQLFLVAILVPASAWAGFEWVPPAEEPKEMVEPIQETVQMPVISVPEVVETKMQPAPPVMAEPVPMVNTPPPVPMMAQPVPTAAPQPMMMPSPAQVMPSAAPVSPFPVGVQEPPSVDSMPKMKPEPVVEPTAPEAVMPSRIYINPYPLMANASMERMQNPSQPVMEQKMMEVSRKLNPVQLGAGMTTGVKAKRIPPARLSKEKSDTSFGVESLTPMMGGEPSPLPGYEGGEPLQQYAQAVGFGKDLPLALALSQVIPEGFTHRFEGSMDPSVTVSWEGGKPWNLVLADMLASQNLTANIDGNVVVIKSVAKV